MSNRRFIRRVNDEAFPTSSLGLDRMVIVAGSCTARQPCGCVPEIAYIQKGGYRVLAPTSGKREGPTDHSVTPPDASCTPVTAGRGLGSPRSDEDGRSEGGDEKCLEI